jgi:hypothetical protein
MKQSSNAIALEYANADPTYVTKTNVRLLLPLFAFPSTDALWSNNPHIGTGSDASFYTDHERGRELWLER